MFVWWQQLDNIRTKSLFRLHFVFNFISIMHPWHTQVRAMHQIAVSNVSRILRSYDLVLLPYDLERDRTINKVCFAGIPSPTQHFFTWLCEQTSAARPAAFQAETAGTTTLLFRYLELLLLSFLPLNSVCNLIQRDQRMI